MNLIATGKSRANVYSFIDDILLKCTPAVGVYLISHGLFFLSTLRDDSSFAIRSLSSPTVTYFSAMSAAIAKPKT